MVIYQQMQLHLDFYQITNQGLSSSSNDDKFDENDDDENNDDDDDDNEEYNNCFISNDDYHRAIDELRFIAYKTFSPSPSSLLIIIITTTIIETIIHQNGKEKAENQF